MAVFSTFLFKYISIFGSFGVRSGSVRDPFGARSGPARANFGPKFSEPKIQNFKKFQSVRPSRRGGVPLAAAPSPDTWRAPAAAVTAAQMENF